MSNSSRDLSLIEIVHDLTRNFTFFVFGYEGSFASSGTLNSNDWIAKMENWKPTSHSNLTDA